MSLTLNLGGGGSGGGSGGAVAVKRQNLIVINNLDLTVENFKNDTIFTFISDVPKNFVVQFPSPQDFADNSDIKRVSFYFYNNIFDTNNQENVNTINLIAKTTSATPFNISNELDEMQELSSAVVDGILIAQNNNTITTKLVGTSYILINGEYIKSPIA